jgi:class 3 adenylate cyclase
VGETRKLAAILVSDVVGYSRLAGADEERTLARLRGLRSDLIDPAIAAHHGRVGADGRPFAIMRVKPLDVAAASPVESAGRK